MTLNPNKFLVNSKATNLKRIPETFISGQIYVTNYFDRKKEVARLAHNSPVLPMGLRSQKSVEFQKQKEDLHLFIYLPHQGLLQLPANFSVCERTKRLLT